MNVLSTRNGLRVAPQSWATSHASSFLREHHSFGNPVTDPQRPSIWRSRFSSICAKDLTTNMAKDPGRGSKFSEKTVQPCLWDIFRGTFLEEEEGLASASLLGVLSNPSCSTWQACFSKESVRNAGRIFSRVSVRDINGQKLFTPPHRVSHALHGDDLLSSRRDRAKSWVYSEHAVGEAGLKNKDGQGRTERSRVSNRA